MISNNNNNNIDAIDRFCSTLTTYLKSMGMLKVDGKTILGICILDVLCSSWSLLSPLPVNFKEVKLLQEHLS
ncbi:hypothetical protein LWI28_023573 [Acer negundo]|uniref:Uncharacterized protein n=1 Tax=Acer negundo TaxID=4023 RepID=A0AAD5IVQ4_ACENE|nr:hypothetical protein LWI28_023573 [Acer negundo]